MVNYATVGSNTLDKANIFYTELLDTIGMTKLFDHPSGGTVFKAADGDWFGVLGPHDGNPATVGNGSMTGFALPTRAAVDAFHAKALSLGATSEGDPGVRGPEEMGLYFGYFRDLDGNKLCGYRVGPA